MKQISLIIELLNFISKRYKRNLIYLILLMLAASIAELFTLASLIPFLTVLSSPNNLSNNKFIIFITEFFNISDTGKLLALVTLSFVLISLLASIIRLLNIYFSAFLAAKIGSNLSTSLYRNILNQPYSRVLEFNTGDIVSKITADINITINVINSLLQLITSFLILLAMLTALFLFNPKIALLSLSIFGSSYGLVAFLIKNRLKINGKKISNIQSKLIKNIQESVGSIKDIILSDLQDYFVGIYGTQDRPLRLLLAQNQFLGMAPRYIMEAISISLIALIAYILSKDIYEEILIIPTLGALALAAQKMLPALQVSYFSWVYVQGGLPSLEAVLYYLKLPKKEKYFQSFTKKNDKFQFENFAFEDLSFRYSENSKYVLKDISLNFKKGEKVGIIGQTGCGKSTLLDIMLGLLEPSSGRVLINGNDIYSNSSELSNLQWRKSIAHVPQDVYLSDSTILENIAFGSPVDQISSRKINEVSKNSNLDEFIPLSNEGFSRIVGDKGIKLSGGQKQRLGIARALYKKHKVLFLDEATSALDNNTENSLIKSICQNEENITIVMIAHRLNSLYGCDKIFCLENGKLIKCITGDDLKNGDY